MRWSELAGNCKNCRIKSLRDNTLINDILDAPGIKTGMNELTDSMKGLGSIINESRTSISEAFENRPFKGDDAFGKQVEFLFLLYHCIACHVIV
ncbi:hypothetical protein [Tindallia californiensis]|uniref:hypothetical protein n=1 Tax=Tindallia californiensis TaxID=159292 RepID=UPI0015A0FC46|nr:hypothetical protein [Tindallia californiensis]